MKYLFLLVFLLPITICADSTTIQLHITANELMIRMPSNHWFMLVEDSVPIYEGAGSGWGLHPDKKPINKPLHYVRTLTFAPTNSIPETDNAIIYVDWTGMKYGCILKQGHSDPLFYDEGKSLYIDTTKEKDQ